MSASPRTQITTESRVGFNSKSRVTAEDTDLQRRSQISSRSVVSQPDNGRTEERPSLPYTRQMPDRTLPSVNDAPRLSFTGFIAWRDLVNHVSLLYPREWHATDGVPAQLTPPPFAPHRAVVSVEARRLPTNVEPDDAIILQEGLEAGVRSIPSAHIERSIGDSVGAMVDLELEHSYVADPVGDSAGLKWKRWLRVMYLKDIQFTISAEAEDNGDFEYWRPAFLSIMRTAQFADWAAQATGRSWEAELSQDQELG